MDAREQIENIVREMNAAWQENRFDDLSRCFHERVVAAPPGAAPRVLGREQMVESFRQFTRVATILEFSILELHVNVFDTTAVASAQFRIRYRMEGNEFDDRGTDVLVFERISGDWEIVWRTQIPSPVSDS